MAPSRQAIWTYGYVIAGCILLSPPALSDILAQHQAHEHGVGQLNLVAERTSVEIELTAPAADIVGFEHRPSTKQQHLKVQKGLDALKSVDRLFSFPSSARCEVRDVDVRSPLAAAGHAEDRSVGQADEKNHDHDRHADEKSEETHADFRAHYKFECERPNELNFVDVHYFKIFPAAREIEAQSISPRGQGSRELTPHSNRLSF